MRHVYSLSLICFIFLSIGMTESFANQEQSIIVEVEGDPDERKEDIEKDAPFIEVVETYDILFNGLALRAKADQLDKIPSFDFIKTIHPVYTYEALEIEKTDNTVIPHTINKTSYTGEDVDIGVIDTGIDYNHPDLNANVKGGYDLVDLDDDPFETRPEEGIPTSHGTHVSGIIAANGELKGVAPNANLYAYRALGSGGQGTSIQVIAALEQAVKDDVDIINLSLGNSINGPDYPTSQAVNQAVEHDVLVVIANGNDGPENWTVGSPATATKAVAVGAVSERQTLPFLVDPLENKKIPLTPMPSSIPWDIDRSYQVVNGEKKDAEVSGNIALLKQNEQSIYKRIKSLAAKGAIGVLIYDDRENDFAQLTNQQLSPIDIPVMALTAKDGAWLLNRIEKKPFYADTVFEEVGRNITPFSSRGPVTVNWRIKPDIIAPGANILSTVPDGYESLQGTSMASPHVAGSMAVLKEAHPTWTNEQIIGALKTTAKRLETEANKSLDPIAQGMGYIQLDEALKAETIIDDPLLSFGKVDENQETKTVDVTIENMTDEEKTYTFSMPKKQKGLRWKLPQTFTLGKKEKKTISIELNVSTTLLDQGIHQGWLMLEEKNEKFHLPYLFMNQTADFPKTMGFTFTLKPHTHDEYMYQLYVAEKAERVQVDLYNPDTLLFDRTLLTLTDVDTGTHEGNVKKEDAGSPGYYKALVTVQLKSGGYESYETEVFIAEET